LIFFSFACWFFLLNKRFLGGITALEASSSVLYRLDVKIAAVPFFLLVDRDLILVLGIGIKCTGLTVND